MHSRPGEEVVKMNFKKFKKLFKKKKKLSSRQEKERRLGFIPIGCNPCCCTGLVILLLVGMLAFGPGGNFIAEWFSEDTITTTTPTTTYPDITDTTDTTTTTQPEEDKFYKVKFSFLWGDNIPDGDKCWVEFAVHNLHDTTPEGKRDQVTLAAGHGDTGDWFYGSWDETFAEGESLTVTMASYDGWYDLFEWPDVTVGSWSHSFVFYSYKYGFSASLTSELRITWELV